MIFRSNKKSFKQMWLEYNEQRKWIGNGLN